MKTPITWGGFLIQMCVSAHMIAVAALCLALAGLQFRYTNLLWLGEVLLGIALTAIVLLIVRTLLLVVRS